MNSEVKTIISGEIFREFVGGVLRREFPKKNGLCRSWHPNGASESESILVNGKVEGVVREWHPNGALKNEYTLAKGKVHGTVKKWNSEGKLLGTYEMANGTGTIYEWGENGFLETRIEVYAEGCMESHFYEEETGRTWINYLWEGEPVNRKKFFGSLEKWRSQY